jgi:hypothetical protein
VEGRQVGAGSNPFISRGTKVPVRMLWACLAGRNLGGRSREKERMSG